MAVHERVHGEVHVCTGTCTAAGTATATPDDDGGPWVHATGWRVVATPRREPSLQRARSRNQRHLRQTGTDENRFEAEGEDFYRRVHAGYAAIAVREPERIALIGPGTGDDGIEAIAARVREVVVAALPRHLQVSADV